jgi:hypothetical protein
MGNAWKSLIVAIMFFIAMCVGLVFASAKTDYSYFDAIPFLIAMGSLSALMSGFLSLDSI